MFCKDVQEIISLWEDELETAIESVTNSSCELDTCYWLRNDGVKEIISMKSIDHKELEKKRIHETKKGEHIWRRNVHKICCERNIYTNTGHTRFQVILRARSGRHDKGFKSIRRIPYARKKVVPAINTETLSAEDKAKSLNAVNLIKQKWDGTIKGITCADKNKQKRYLGKDESVASPTVSLESLFTTLVIDAYEERDIATFDIPGVYLHADIPSDKNVILKLHGNFVDIMCDTN